MGTVVSAKYTLELSCPESRGRRNGQGSARRNHVTSLGSAEWLTGGFTEGRGLCGNLFFRLMMGTIRLFSR